jgi:DNA mismatch endonuclease, patch repair protein
MADNLTVEQRKKNMSAIKSRHTKPEIIVRSMLHRLGFRFRLHNKKLPGKPDIILPKYKTVIFVHGCFWHQHKGCKRSTIPKSNTNYWIPKLTGNVKRDVQHKSDLKNAGWNVAVVWECETKDTEKLAKKLENIFV